MKILSIANQKGGVGKTTLTANLGASLAQMGKQVLLIDADALCALTKSLGYAPDAFPTSVITAVEKPDSSAGAIYSTDIEGLSLMPSSPLLDSLEFTLRGSKKSRFTLFKQLLTPLDSYFDYVLIDCSPSLNTFTINALACADAVLSPTETKWQSHFAFETFYTTYTSAVATINPDLLFLGVVATMYDPRTTEDNAVLEVLQQQYTVRGIIKRSAAVSKSVNNGVPAVMVDKKSPVVEVYRTIATKIMEVFDGAT